MNRLADAVLKIRPAALASLVARVCRLDKRRMVETAEGTFFLNPVSHLGSALLHGNYEPQTTAILSRFLQPGGVFIDMGANEGYFSVVASRLVGAEGTVISVEPQSRLQSVIQANLAANRSSNVRLVRCVVSDRTGNVELSLSPDTHTGSSSLFRQTKYTLPTEEVPSFSLGDFLDRVGVQQCDLVKIDIEGSEYDVLMAAGDVLRRGALKHIAIEIHHSVLVNRGLSADTLHDHLIDCGYQLDKQVGPYDYPHVYSYLGK
jgi:FkbM family methyltransferase